MPASLEKGANFIWENARLIDRVQFEHLFLEGDPHRIIDVLRTYQNPDGGFGHALEPDVRAPDSQPLFVEEGFRILYECGLRDADLAYRACDFLALHSDLSFGVPTLFPSSQIYPHAPHWNNPASRQPSMDRLVMIVGLLNWQHVQHPWLEKAVEVCLKRLPEADYDAHTIRGAFTLLESLCVDRDVSALFDFLASKLPEVPYYIAEAPVEQYGLTPLAFAPSPDSYTRKLFTDSQIEAHLEDLESQQMDDGGWSINWVPPSEAARWEWRAEKTVKALAVLNAHGRL